VGGVNFYLINFKDLKHIIMKKLLLFFLALTVACSSGDDSSDNNGSDSCNITASLTTLPITNIQGLNASVNGVIELTSDCEIPNNTVQGFVYSTSIQPTINDNVVNANGIQVSALLLDLTPLQTYYVRTFVTNNEIGTEYGNEVSFQAGNPIYLADNGITVKAYEWANVGDTGVVNGVTYVVMDREMVINPSIRYCTSKITDMNFMFSGTYYNQPVGDWDVSNVTDMWAMFQSATVFNQDLSNWDVSNVTNMDGMFGSATSFNQDISNWDVSNVSRMSGMFTFAAAFNQDISNWNVDNVTSCEYFDGNTPQWTLPKPNFTNCIP
jgi:surface protein